MIDTKLKLVDTGGEFLERCKAFQNDKPDGFMVFFAIDNIVSFENVKDLAIECMNVDQNIPRMLVCAKADLRAQ